MKLAMEVMQVKKLSPHAIIPSRGSKYAAGFDLSSAYDVMVPARGKALVKTGSLAYFDVVLYVVCMLCMYVCYSLITRSFYCYSRGHVCKSGTKKWFGLEKLNRCRRWCY